MTVTEPLVKANFDELEALKPEEDFVGASIKKIQEILLSIQNPEDWEKSFKAYGQFFERNAVISDGTNTQKAFLINALLSIRLNTIFEPRKQLSFIMSHADFLAQFFSQTLTPISSTIIAKSIVFLFTKLQSRLVRKIEIYVLPEPLSRLLKIAAIELEKLTWEGCPRLRAQRQNNFATFLWDFHFYFYNNGRPQSRKEAIALWKVAAENGEPNAQYNLGGSIFDGEPELAAGLPLSGRIELALTYLEPAAEKGNIDALNLLAEITLSKNAFKDHTSEKNSENKRVQAPSFFYIGAKQRVNKRAKEETAPIPTM